MRYKAYSQNNYYHIFNRGVSKMKLFKKDPDYRYFMYIISKNIFKHRIELDIGCVMPNHFHLFIKAPKISQTISKLLFSIQLPYAKYFNYNFDHSGHVFQGPYQFKEVFTEKSKQNVREYIRQNPVDAKLVEKPEDWPYFL